MPSFPVANFIHRAKAGLLLAGFVVLLFVHSAVPVHGAGADSASERYIVREAMDLIGRHALYPLPSLSVVNREQLRGGVRGLDEYSDYLSREEYQGLLESTTADYFGVEMEIRRKGRSIVLFPFEGGVAEKHGILTGDELIAVDGMPVDDASVFFVGSMIRGAEGATVKLAIRSGMEPVRTLHLRRQQAHYESVRGATASSTPYIRLTRFMDDTDQALSRRLSRIEGNAKAVVIDLRGNQGGSLSAAEKCAALFLNQGDVVYRLRTKSGTKSIAAEKPAVFSNSLVLLQDENTASAAEVFIAALTANRKALSAGRKTYGKGLAQRFLPLSDGSALFLTYGELLPPDNRAFNGIGLDPTVSLPQGYLDADFAQDTSLRVLLYRVQQTTH